MRTGIFGGAFDPIHKGHIKAACRAAEYADLHRVIFVPGGISPFKGMLSTDSSHRYNMVSIAIGNFPKFSVSDIEINKRSPGYTYDTVCEFKNLYPNDELFFIMGDDQYVSFDKWYKKDELLSLCTFLVVTRNGSVVEPPFVPVDMIPIDVSSTEIRHGLEKGVCPTKLDENVFEYIKANKLYVNI